MASLLSRLLDEHGWKDAELARRARITAELLHSASPAGGFDQFYAGAANKVDNRLYRIMIGRIRSDRTEHKGLAEGVAWDQMAKEVYSDEIEVYARTLSAHAPWLACAGKSAVSIQWDPEDPDNKPEHLEHLLKVYEKMSAGVYVFSMTPPPELMPEEFMHAYHDAVFRDGGVSAERTPIYKFSTVGNRRREWLQKPLRVRAATFTYATYVSAIKDVASGAGLYSEINKDLRRECLERMRELIHDETRGIRIVVADDVKREHSGPAFRNLHSLIVCLDVLSLEWGQDWKVKYWVGRSDKTVRNWQEAHGFISDAKHNTPEKVGRLLSKLAAGIK